ncbi:hypothetical protein CEXT_597371 [Caerostris extrusa]|uniref:Uncharacterized protein n=1 Tax=Caerostris extrusa TaxID=172846 RepID=A0AAV4W529_CAEEX|nr:hypothetical protein CEXT_44581 [Caerostris extrusa]GIY76698.1 hypothetical protein CEXT_597371 [Caerostris extrusa]
MEMAMLSTRMEPINESEERRTQSSESHDENDSITEVRVVSTSPADENSQIEDTLKDEIDLMEEMKSDTSGSPKVFIKISTNLFYKLNLDINKEY